MFGFVLRVAIWLASYLLYFAIKFLICYSYYFTVFCIFKILNKLRVEVYNQRCKIQASSESAILVTGATSGIGLALAKYLNKKGFTIFACYYSKEEPGYAELAELDLKQGGASIFLVELNVRSQESISNSYEKVRTILKGNKLRLHALINNAGIAQFSRTQWSSKEDIVATVETNLLGPMLVTKQYLPLLAKTRNSRIVNVGSCISFFALPYCGVYGATKSALAYYSKSLGLDIAHYGVRTVTIHPGNLMKNTSILLHPTKLDSIRSEMSADERELFGAELEVHEREKALTEQQIKNYQAKLKAETGKETKKKQKSFGLRDLAALASGCLKNGVNMENSSLMLSFDNAVRMRNPPDEMFAGNMFYGIVIGVLFESLGYDTRRLMAKYLGNYSARKRFNH